MSTEPAVARFTRTANVARKERADCYMKRGETERAIADLSRAIELEPEEIAFRWDRADAYMEIGAFDAAIADLTHVLASEHGEDAQAYWLRGHAHQKRGDGQVLT